MKCIYEHMCVWACVYIKWTLRKTFGTVLVNSLLGYKSLVSREDLWLKQAQCSLLSKLRLVVNANRTGKTPRWSSYVFTCSPLQSHLSPLIFLFTCGLKREGKPAVGNMKSTNRYSHETLTKNIWRWAINTGCVQKSAFWNQRRGKTWQAQDG